MPFPDEISPDGIVLRSYRPTWPAEAAELSDTLRSLVPDAVAVEHIGSTSVPGMAATDCLDIMVVVDDLAATEAGIRLPSAGFRRRPEAWNQEEPAGGRMWPKMVFAPAEGARRANIHIRRADAPTTRRALLFRDFLIASHQHAVTWGALKRAAAMASADLSQYGAIKDPAWLLLMESAERWADETGWTVPWVAPSAS